MAGATHSVLNVLAYFITLGAYAYNLLLKWGAIIYY